MLALTGGTENAAQVYESSTRKAGNLILLDKGLNIGAQQKPFLEKCKDHYKSATFFGLTSDLIKTKQWTVKEIDSRTRWLAAMFDVIWSPEKNPSPVVQFSEWLKTN